MAEQIPEELRAHFARHNNRVLLLGLLSLVIVVALWAALYFVVYWLSLLALTIVRGAEAETPRFALEIFMLSGVLLCVLVAVTPRKKIGPPDGQSFWQIALDIVLAVPRATVTAWSTLRAYQFLNEAELRLAWRLLQRIGSERRLSVSQIPSELPNQRLQEKIVLALQLVDLIYLHRAGDDLVLILRERGRSLAEPRVRLATPR